MSSNRATNVSLTGSTLVCGEGAGIEIRMVEPNDADLDKYHYVGRLILTTDAKQKSGINPEHTLQSTTFEVPSPLPSPYAGLDYDAILSMHIAENFGLGGTYWSKENNHTSYLD